MKLLHIDSSVLDANSVTRTLGRAVVEHWKSVRPDTAVDYRDLDRQPLSHLTFNGGAGAQADSAAESERVLAQFLDADVIVLGAPMYNFGIPSTLKAWIDRVAVAGRTFRYTAAGPEGLAGGKTLVLVTAAGGTHAGTDRDFVEPYLRQVFGFLGIDDIRVVRAEGVALSPAHRETAIKQALAALPEPLRQAA